MLRLYHCPETRSMRCLWLLHELGVPFELIEMPFDLSVTRAPAYLAVHPLGRVPALVDGDLRLFESGAILQYLCERFPDAGLGRPLGDAERYPWLQWIHFGETIAVHAAALVQQYHFIGAADRSEVILKLERRRLVKAVQLIESELAARDYLLAGGFSAADISVGYSVHLAHRFVPLERLPATARYYDRLRRRPAFAASLPSGWRRPLDWLLDAGEPLPQ